MLTQCGDSDLFLICSLLPVVLYLLPFAYYFCVESSEIMVVQNFTRLEKVSTFLRRFPVYSLVVAREFL